LVKNVAHPFDPFGLSSVKKNSTGISTGYVKTKTKSNLYMGNVTLTVSVTVNSDTDTHTN